MAVIINEIKPLKLFRANKFYYPYDPKHRMLNSAVYLLTPDTESTIKVLNNPAASLNKIAFKSFYTEKNINLFINESGNIGLDKNQYDESDVSLLESFNSSEEPILHEGYLSSNDEYSFFPDLVDEALNEATERTKYGSYNFSSIFKRMLYRSRMKSQKDILNYYKRIKKEVPFIKYTYSNLDLYKNKNIFFDFSYYTKAYFEHIPKGYEVGERGIDLFIGYLSRFLKYSKMNDMYPIKTIVVPVSDWINGQDNPFDYKTKITPISVFWRVLRNRPEVIIEGFKDYTFLFLGNQNCIFTFNPTEFKFSPDYAKFTNLITKIHKEDYSEAEESKTDSRNAILLQLADKLDSSGIHIDNLTGGTEKLTREDLDKNGALSDPESFKDDDVKKAALVNKLGDIADKSTNAEDAQKKLNNPDTDEESEWLKDLLMDLQSDKGIKMSAARVDRMNKSRKEILGKEVDHKTVGELLKEFKENDNIPEEEIPVESIDDSWKHMKFTNFNKTYDIEPDIVAMFMHFQNVTHPMNVISINKENTSTAEDYKDTWTCHYEDAETGKRYTMKLDIPRLINNRFMKLRGNEKTLIGQMMLLPITKTDTDTVQIVSNYSKIFVVLKSPSGFSKSTPVINKICKALNKYTGRKIKIHTGDNRKVCVKYQLPMEFVDMASLFNKIEFPDGSMLNFNMDNLITYPFDRSTLSDEDKKLSDDQLTNKYISCYINEDGKRVPIPNDVPFDQFVLEVLKDHDDSGKLINLYNSASVAKRLMYAEASIMSTRLPVIVLLSYCIGLQKVLDRMGVEYEFSESRPRDVTSYIRFSDGYLGFKNTSIKDTLLLNGLMECDFSDYSIKEINEKDIWLDILDGFGGRIKADGFDNFYDLMFDPITKEICHILHIPDNFVDGLIYACHLLSDNKYIKHADISGNRLRVNEIIVGHLYNVLSRSFGSYRNMIKRNKGTASFSAKITAVIDSILNHDQTSSDLSTSTPLLEVESANKVTFKGLSGMNSERAFSIDKRTYDKSMLGVLGLSTGAASTVGINRQTTIDAGVINKRGFFKARDPKELTNTNTLTVGEALAPLATNHDDPIRSCMAFTQTVQHQMKVKKAMPNLITNGADEALPYLTSNKFSWKFEGKRGVVEEVTDDYIIVKDLDTGKCDYIDTRELIQKNSDGGFFVTIKLTPMPNIKKGMKIKHNDILAYDTQAYSESIGQKGSGSISYNIGTMAKVAIMDTDLGYEDSCVVDADISEAMESEVIIQKDVSLDPNTNVYNLIKIGDKVEEGDPLLVFQDAFEEKEANELIAAIAKDTDTEMLSDLGRKQVHAKVSGTIQDIKIYRTCDMDKLSPTLKKICTAYEGKINKLKNVMRKYDIDKTYTLEATDKLPKEGKLKSVDGVRIEIYIKVKDKFGIGDKLVFYQALKGVNSTIIPRGQEAYTDFRPNEHINAFLTIDGVMARMVTSAISNGLINKIIIELTRQCQEKMGIKWRPIQDILRDTK